MTTERAWVRGTLLYMSPEHIQGFGVTARSDIYSLGTLLYECLAGIHPVLVGAERLSLDDVALRQIAQMPPPLYELLPEVPAYLARIIQQMLAKEAVLRFGTMDEVANRLRECRSQVLAESGGSESNQLEQRPYIVFPSSAIGMKAAAAPDESRAVDDVVAGAERIVTALAATQTVDNSECLQPRRSSEPALSNQARHRRQIVIAVTLGALAGIVFALTLVLSSRPDTCTGRNWPSATASGQPASNQPPTASLQQPGSPEVSRATASALGQPALSPSTRPKAAELSPSEDQNQNKTNSYGSGIPSHITSQHARLRSVINPNKTRVNPPKASSPVPSQLVF